MVDINFLVNTNLDPLKLSTVISQVTPTLEKLDNMAEGRAILSILTKAQEDLEPYINAKYSKKKSKKRSKKK